MLFRSLLALFTGVFARVLAIAVLVPMVLVSALLALGAFSLWGWPVCYDWRYDMSMSYDIINNYTDRVLEQVDVVYVYKYEERMTEFLTECEYFGNAVAVIADERGIASATLALESRSVDLLCPDLEYTGPTFHFLFLDAEKRLYAPFYCEVDPECPGHAEIWYPDTSSHYSVSAVPWLREQGLLE